MAAHAQDILTPRERETGTRLTIHRPRPPRTRVVIPLEGLQKPVVRIPSRASRNAAEPAPEEPAPARDRSSSRAGERAKESLGALARRMPTAFEYRAPLAAPQASHKPPSDATLEMLLRPRPPLARPARRRMGVSRAMRHPLNTLPDERQKLLLALHVIPWLLLMVVAFGLLPAPFRFENWSAPVQTGALLGFCLYAALDTSFAIWHVAFRRQGRQVDRL